jgi:Domain of unknown function (DUF1707)
MARSSTMTEGSTSPAGDGQLRIGTAERTAAMKALDVHLDAGRLGVEEYGDRSAIAAGATLASELQALFTDLPEPHPALPGTTPALQSTSTLPVPRDDGTVANKAGNFLDVAAPRIMAVIPFVAMALFFIVGGWWWWLLIPAAGALLYSSRHGDHDHDREREERRRTRDERRRDH